MALQVGSYSHKDLKCDEQRATYYIGGICCLMPEVTDDIQEGVRQKGNRVRIVRVPSGAEPNGLVIQRKRRTLSLVTW
ncbi:unnamed protein product [Arabis nemorensis]|uniref:Uncharacterized protein n=1 Tax=Arabis nemorensis TaxID=586526 RepID=A0A565CB36_9BRAS|nr:unnamed protein product [Arabis nemorensis]